MPWQFWRLTPRELALQFKAYRWRTEQERWRAAEILAAIYDTRRAIVTALVNPRKLRQLRKPLTAEDLLGKKKRAVARTPDEQLARFRELTVAMGGTIHEVSAN